MKSLLLNVALGACLLLGSAVLSTAQSVHENGDRMSEVLASVEAGDWASASHIASSISDASAQELVEWFRLRAGEGDWAEYLAFLERNPHWPGLKRLRRKGEEVIPRRADPSVVRAYFDAELPQTGRGALRLAEAEQRLGRTGQARDAAIRAWLELSMSEQEENALLAEYRGVLARHHVTRLDNLLWRGLTREAQRMLDRVDAGHKALAMARIALRRGARGVDDLIKAVPASLQKHPGLAYERFVWRIKKERWDDAEALLSEITKGDAELGKPDAWASRRRGFARRALRRGDIRDAYLMASKHGLTSADGYSYSDLEWLSGYIALRHFRKPDLAIAHFTKFRKTIATPISMGRAGYWLGRAHEAAGHSKEAKAAYQLAATYQTSFYGQLAAERADLPTDASLIGATPKKSWRGARFLHDPVFSAAMLMHYADEPRYLRWFLTHMAETMTSVDQAKLAQLALEIERPHVALKVAKEAAKSGTVVSAPYYPVTELAYFDVEVPPELAMAIARQESELNPEAVSPAGARGLMQIMPSTARKVAEDVGAEYTKSRLTSDWRYNARLGIAYLGGLVEEFNGSVLLAAAAYNAGPNRVRSWLEEYGDPRHRSVNKIDWIENIPYRETRNYVQRVLESLHVYRLRINGEIEPVRLAKELSRGG